MPQAANPPSTYAPEQPVANPTILLFSVSLGLFATNLVLAWRTAAWSVGWTCGLLAMQTVLLYLLFTPMHEAVHRTASRHRWLNSAVLIISGLCFASDGRLFRRIHLTHHAHTNRPGRDPDHFTAHPSLVWRWVKAFALTGAYYQFVASKMRRDVSPGQAALSGALPVLILAAAAATGHTAAAVWGWLVPLVIAQGVLGFIFTSWPHHPGKDTSRVGNTRVAVGSRLLGWLMLGQHLHLVHHYKVDVPWYRYERYWRDHGAKLVAAGAVVYTVGRLRPTRGAALLAVLCCGFSACQTTPGPTSQRRGGGGGAGAARADGEVAAAGVNPPPSSVGAKTGSLPPASEPPAAALGATVDPVDQTGNGDHDIAPPYRDAPEEARRDDVAHGDVQHFKLDSSSSHIYTGQDPWLKDPGPFSRDLWVYIPAAVAPGTELALLVVQDGGSYLQLPNLLDNLIHDAKVPPLVAVLINPGPGDGVGSQRGLEYDTVSGAYATFVETEVLPLISSNDHLKITSRREGRATMGGSSGAAAAFTMAWFHPEWYSRVLSYSGTFVSQHPDATYPHGAWQYHETLIPAAPRKDLRIFLEVGDNDNNFNDAYHSWPQANQNMAKVLKDKGYSYQYVYAKGAGHVDGRVVKQTLAGALVWLWRGWR